MALNDFNSLSFDKEIKGEDLDRVQDSIKTFINQFINNLTLDGTLIKDVSLAIGANTIQNPLQRPINGFYVTKQDAQADIWGSVFTNSNLTIHASAAVIVDIWVF